MEKSMIIFYYTGTGNTKYVCDYLEKTTKSKGFSARSLPIYDLTEKEIRDYIDKEDIIFIAYPIYGSDMPENMKRFIDNLPQVESKKLGVVCTQLMFSGDGGSIEFKKLKSKGFIQLWSYQVCMPNNLSVKGSPLKQHADYQYNENKYLIKARKKIDKISEDVIGGRKRVYDNSVFHHFLGLLQRPYYRRWYLKKEISKLKVNQERCIQCNLCVDSCPNNVLEKIDNQVKFVNLSRCTMCLRCLNFCPKTAIELGGPAKLPTYKGPTKEIYGELFKRKKNGEI
jgi:formate hydrogenlyase subunit 6/NADH:ubiquinone oxidoreductase subunit I/flavodoxin